MKCRDFSLFCFNKFTPINTMKLCFLMLRAYEKRTEFLCNYIHVIPMVSRNAIICI